MERVWIAGHNIISPLGNSTKINYESILKEQIGVTSEQMGTNTICIGRISERDRYRLEGNFGTFESLLIRSIEAALASTAVNASSKETLFILSSTKGEIDSLTTHNYVADVNLFESGRKIVSYFDNPNLPIVISNACISGSLAILTAKRLIDSGRYNHAVVAGCDLVSDFVTSGFNSLQAISPEPCKPFDKNRKGINLGEASAAIIISKSRTDLPVAVASGATSNDANHISGPSRTGAELALAIEKALKEAGLSPHEVDFVNAHGTATLYNDEMEANAFNLAALNATPLNSLKGYYGHTLGAAGIIESIISIESLLHNELVPSMGYETQGVSKPINVIQEKETKPLRNFIKTASGFGGCNAALVFQQLD